MESRLNFHVWGVLGVKLLLLTLGTLTRGHIGGFRRSCAAFGALVCNAGKGFSV